MSFGLTSVFYKENPRQHSSHRVELCFEKNPLGVLTIPERLLPPLFPLLSWWPLEYKNSSGPGLTFWCHGMEMLLHHNDVIKWQHFPRYWPFVRGIHRSPVNSPHKGQWRGALMFSFICALNKRLSKQSWGCWFETPSRSLWRHCNDSLHKGPVMRNWWFLCC